MVLIQKLAELPKIGDHVPVESFHVSKTNVNVDEPFGDCEEDQQLIANLKAGNKIIQPFKARLEGNGFGVYLGRRRFLAKKEAGTNFFVAGVDCLIEEISEEEAEEASWLENCFRKEMNSINRAKTLQKIVNRYGGIRPYAHQSGLPASTLCEYLSVLKLGTRMQLLLAKGVLSYKDGVELVRMNLKPEAENKLAEIVEKKGPKALRELTRKKREYTKHRLPKPEKDRENVVDTKAYWKKLTESLKEFADIFSDYCTIKEWEDADNYHLKLEAVMPKNLNESMGIPGHSLETLSADEAPQICGLCGGDLLEGDPFAEKDGIYYCRKCVEKEPNLQQIDA